MPSEKSAPSPLETFQSTAKAVALAELKKCPEVLQTMIAAAEKYFPSTVSLSSIQQQYLEVCLNGPNTSLETTIAATLDYIDMVMTASAKFQYYVTLTVPKIEDGNNFGVGVQLEVLKAQNDFCDKLVKHMEELTRYQSSRAEAIEKCKLPSSTSTKTSTKSESEAASTGGEKGDSTTTNKSNAMEEKTIESIVSPTALEASTRESALAAVDVLFYTKAKVAFQAVLLSYMTICNYMEKNSEKLDKPKGDKGSNRGGYSNMY